MKKLLTLSLFVAAWSVTAQPVQRSGWTTTTSASTARTALAAAGQTDLDDLRSAAAIGYTTNGLVDASFGSDALDSIREMMTTNTRPLRVLIWGDSLSSSDWDATGVAGRGMHEQLYENFGYSGYSGRSQNTNRTGQWLGNATVVSGTARVNCDSLSDTEWWGMYHTISNSGVVQFGNNVNVNGDYGNSGGVFWKRQARGGQFQFWASKDGAAFTSLATVNAYSATNGAGFTNFALAAGYYRFIVTNLTGTNFILGGPECYDTNSTGVLINTCQRGGEYIATLTNYAGITSDFMTAFRPDLIIHQGDEVAQIGSRSAAQTVYTNFVIPWWFTLTNSRALVIANAFRGDAEPYPTYFTQERQMWNDLAHLYPRLAVFDSGYYVGSWLRATNLGYMRQATSPADIIHWNGYGAKTIAGEVMRWAGLTTARRLGPGVSAASTSLSGVLTNAPWLNENGTNFIWVELKDMRRSYDGVSIGDATHANGPYLVQPHVYGYPQLWGYAATWSTNGSGFRIAELPGIVTTNRNFRFTALWLAPAGWTNNIAADVAGLNAGVPSWVQTDTSFQYPDSGTNTVKRDVRVVTLGYTPDGFVNPRYGISSGNPAICPLLVGKIKIEVW